MALLMHFGENLSGYAWFNINNTISIHFHGDIDIADLPAYNYLRSIHNISSERSWLRLRLDLGDNAVLFFNKGIEDGVYNSDDVNH
jgi:hypothetical protein